jgi:uncharacterized protein involved in outer membrane biogenesis
MRWKWILGVLFVLVVVFIVTTYAILSNYDFNGLKPQMALAVKDATGRELTLAGDIELEIGLRPTLIVEDVGLQNAPWGSRPELAKIKRLQIRVALLPLIIGTVEVRRLILIEPDLLIESNKSGKSNLEFETAKQDNAAKPKEQVSTGGRVAMPALVMREMSIQNGRLTFKDGQSGKTYAVALESLTAVAGPDNLIALGLRGAYNSRPCQAEGTVGRLANLTNPGMAWPVKLTVKAVGSTVAIDGTIKDVFNSKGLALAVQARGQSIPDVVELFNVKNFPDLGPFKVSGNLADPGGKLRLTNLNLLAGTENLGTIELTGAVKDLVEFQGLALTVNAQSPSIANVVELFNVNDFPDLGPFKVSGNLTDPADKLTVTDLDLYVGSEDMAKIQLAGVVKDVLALTEMELDFSIQGKEVANLKEVTGEPLPFKGPFRMSGHAVSPSAKTFKVPDLKTSVGRSDLIGSVEVILTGAKPQMKAVLSSRQLDLRPLLSMRDVETQDKTQAPASPSGKQEDKFFPDDTLPLDALSQAQANVEIRAERVLLPLLILNDLTAHVILDDGHLAATPLKCIVGNGTLGGRLDLRSQGQTSAMNLALRIDQFDLGHTLKEIGVEDVLDGKIDMEIDLQSHGDSIAGLMAGLNGNTVVIMDEGRIKDEFISLLGGDVSHTLYRLLNPDKETTAKYTEIHCLVIGLDILNGLAKSTALVLDTSHTTIVGHGKINLATEELDLSLKPFPKKGVTIKGLGKFSLSLGELTKPLKVGGTLAHPSLAIDPSGTLVTLGKAIGGAALLGPVGIAAALTSGKLGEEDPCFAAIEAAEKGLVDTKKEKSLK